MADPIPGRDVERRLAVLEAAVLRQDAGGVVTVPNDQRLEIRAGSTTIVLENGNVSIQGIGTVRIDGSVIELNAAQVQINSAVVHATGVVNCDTIIARSVVGSSYTPGAGNMW
jgi:hypothetical protein